jgi:hypothetical protein
MRSCTSKDMLDPASYVGTHLKASGETALEMDGAPTSACRRTRRCSDSKYAEALGPVT